MRWLLPTQLFNLDRCGFHVCLRWLNVLLYLANLLKQAVSVGHQPPHDFMYLYLRALIPVKWIVIFFVYVRMRVVFFAPQRSKIQPFYTVAHVATRVHEIYLMMYITSWDIFLALVSTTTIIEQVSIFQSSHAAAGLYLRRNNVSTYVWNCHLTKTVEFFVL